MRQSKYSPLIASARNIWQQFKNRKLKLSFEEFHLISQMNCHLCNATPNNIYNRSGKIDGYFIYNGITKDEKNAICHSCCRAKIAQKNEPWMASAKRVFKSYRQHRECHITFEQFYKLSQMDCEYCGVPPSNKYNVFNEPRYLNRGSNIFKRDGYFIYNGLDRINSDGYYNLNNIVSCCYTCNIAKRERDVKEFLTWVNRLKPNEFKFNIEMLPLPNNDSLISINSVYRKYNDGDLSIEEVYSISQMQCFYCESQFGNLCNWAKLCARYSEQIKNNADFKYNGLDRIDSSIGHMKNNVVPCCKWCNYAKNDLSLSQFYKWVKRIQTHQQNKKSGEKSPLF